MAPIHLTPEQIELIEQPLEASIFLKGPAGSGKTTVGVERLLYLMAHEVQADSILLLLPQLPLASPYNLALQYPGVVGGGEVDVLTFSGLAQRMIEGFWTEAAEAAGFANPQNPPVFLNFETAEYFLAKVLEPLLEQGYFSQVTLERSRLYAQLLGNLNRASAARIPMEQVGPRLLGAWSGGSGLAGKAAHLRLAGEIQEVLGLFRRYCLDHNLLDFSLQVEFFLQQIWSLPECQQVLRARYQHLIADNLEEDIPAAHDLLLDWLPRFQSALLIYDQDSGYRYLLGADPGSAIRLKEACRETASLMNSFVTSPPLENLAFELKAALAQTEIDRTGAVADREATGLQQAGLEPPLYCPTHRFYPQMLDWACQQVARLVKEEQVPPGEIVLLAPYLSGALRFSLAERLEQLGVASCAHRPSRPLREEPAAQCLLTLIALAHPGWGLLPTRLDMAHALVVAIESLDPVRAQLLTEIVYRTSEGQPGLSSFDRINPRMRERITPSIGQRYENLRQWIGDYQNGQSLPLEDFIDRLVEDLLGKPGYGFNRNIDAQKAAGQMIESVQSFTLALESAEPEGDRPAGEACLRAVQAGLAPGQYIAGWQIQPQDAVLLAPAYTFVQSNQAVDFQVWLDVGGSGWSERPYQPLSHPYVLQRRWPAGAAWGDDQELTASREVLARLVVGLVRRCRQRILCGISELDEQGYAQRGPLLEALQQILSTRAPRTGNS
jgi:hypothetical protein